MSDVAGQHVGASALDADLVARTRDETARHWKLLLTIGILCELVGIYSIFVPIVASISVTVLVGWAILFGGIVQLGHLLRGELSWDWDVAWRLLVAVLTTIAGAWILIFPLSGAITLTVVLVVWFWAVGVARLYAWWRVRGMESTWLIGVNGAVSVLLGILIWADLPSSSTWAIGLLVGIELLFAGSSLVMTAITGRQLAQMN